MVTGTAATAVVKWCGHVILHFMSTSLSDRVANPNYHKQGLPLFSPVSLMTLKSTLT